MLVNLDTSHAFGSTPRLHDESTDWQLRTLITS